LIEQDHVKPEIVWRAEGNVKSICKKTSRSRNWLVIAGKTALLGYILILFAGSVTSPTTAFYHDEKQMNGRITIGTWESDQQETSDEEIEVKATEFEQNDESNQTEEKRLEKENEAESNKILENGEKETEQTQQTDSTHTEETKTTNENNPESTITKEDIDHTKHEEEGEKVENKEDANVD
jgi:hypothetical protein